MRLVAVVALSWLLALTGCGSHVERDEWPGGAAGATGSAGSSGTSTSGSECPLFYERWQDHCRPVVVEDIDDQSIWFESGGYLLPGTLTLPITEGEYRAPGAIILHGTGPGPRDGTSWKSLGFAYPEPVHTYQNLAESLARAGLAVLRYDKRTCFHEQVHACKNSIADYPGDPNAIVLDDFVADARAAAQFVADRPEVRDTGVVALGHSEGGVLVTALLGEDSVVGSAVLLSAPSMAFERTATGQLELYANHLEELGPTYDEEVQALRDKAERWQLELDQIRNGVYPSSSWEGASLSYVRSTLDWYDSLEQRFVDARGELLVLSGTSDLNVWPAHLEGYQFVASEHQLKNVSFSLLNDVTHAFCLAPPADSWAPFEPTLAPEARDQLLAWIRASKASVLSY